MFPKGTIVGPHKFDVEFCHDLEEHTSYILHFCSFAKRPDILATFRVDYTRPSPPTNKVKLIGSCMRVES